MIAPDRAELVANAARQMERAQLAVADAVSRNESELRALQGTLHESDVADALADVLAELSHWRAASDAFLRAAAGGAE